VAQYAEQRAADDEQGSSRRFRNRRHMRHRIIQAAGGLDGVAGDWRFAGAGQYLVDSIERDGVLEQALVGVAQPLKLKSTCLQRVFRSRAVK